jgi:hypothetical protein
MPGSLIDIDSIRAFRAPFSVPAMNSVDSRHNIPLDPSPKREHVARIGAEFDVVHVDPPLNLSGLMRTFEVARDDIAVLDDFNGFQVAPGPGDIVGVDYPIAGDVVRWVFLHRSLCMHDLWSLEEHQSGTSDGSTQRDGV